MKLDLFVAMLTVSLLFGCTRKSDLELRTEEYDVVEEGTTDGWSDDLGVTQVAPLTETNADTTTSFSLLGTDVPADSTALPEDAALSSRLGSAVTTAPARSVGAPPSGAASASRTSSAAPPPSRPAEPRRRETPQPPASTRPAQVPRDPAPTTTRQAEPAEEPAPQQEPRREPEPAPEPTPPTSTRTDTAPPPGPAEPAPDPPPSDDSSLDDSAARR